MAVACIRSSNTILNMLKAFKVCTYRVIIQFKIDNLFIKPYYCDKTITDCSSAQRNNKLYNKLVGRVSNICHFTYT